MLGFAMLWCVVLDLLVLLLMGRCPSLSLGIRGRGLHQGECQQSYACHNGATSVPHRLFPFSTSGGQCSLHGEDVARYRVRR